MGHVIATVMTVLEGEAVLELADGTRRTVPAPDEIEITVGMSVKMVEVGNDIPVIGWGV